MKKPVKETIHAKGLEIGIYTTDFENEFISLTDIARYKSDDPNDVIRNWMRGRDTIEFLGLWESLHNPNFKPVEFDGFRNQAGTHAFTMSPSKWIAGVDAIGIVVKPGRYGGTYAHTDIAMSFATWISPEFQLYIMKDYRRLKSDENSRLSLNWNSVIWDVRSSVKSGHESETATPAGGYKSVMSSMFCCNRQIS